MKYIACTIATILFATFCDAAEIRFNPEGQSSGGIVLLGDIAEITYAGGERAGDLASVRLFPAPVSGGQKIVTATQVRDLLSNQGVSSLDHTFTGAGQIAVTGPQNIASITANSKRRQAVNSRDAKRVEDELIETLITYLDRCTADGRPENRIPWEIKVKLDTTQVNTIAKGGAIIGMYGGSNPLVGKQEFQAELEGIDAVTGRRTLVRFFADIALPPRVVVAKRSIERNKILNENDLVITYRNDIKGGDYYSDVKELVGKSVVNNIRDDAVITSRMVQNPILVRKGDVVTVYAKASGIAVKDTAKALDNGSLGDLVTLQRLKSRTENGRNISRSQVDDTFVAMVSGIKTADILVTPNATVY